MASTKKAKNSKKTGSKTGKKKPASTVTVTSGNVELDPRYGKSIDVPVADLCHESRELEAIVERFKEKLVTGSRLDASLCDELKPRRKTLEAAEQDWLSHRLTLSSERKETVAQSETLKKDMIAALRYFLHTDEAVQARVDDIIPGSGIADLLDDLQKLAVLLRENADALKRADLPADAAAQAERFAALLGSDDLVRSVATSEQGRHLIGLRNHAFWRLREAMDEIRAAGRYVYRNDPKRLPLFRASGTRARQPQRPSAPTPTPDPAA